MKKNAMVGIALVVAAVMSAVLIAASSNGVVDGLVGKAIWYLPYAALVVGVRKLSVLR